MAFDVKTIFSLLFLVDIFIAVFLLLYKTLIKINAPKLNSYVIAKLLQAISLIFATNRSELPYLVSVIFSNIPVYYGLAFEVYSFSSFGNRTIKKKLRWYLLIATIFSVIFLINVNNIINIRIFITFLIFCILFLLSAIDLITVKPTRKIKRIVGILLLIIAITSLLRSIDGALSAREIRLFTNSFSEILVFASYFSISIILSISFFFLLKEEDETTILENNQVLNDIIKGMPDEIYVFNQNKEILYSNFDERNPENTPGLPNYCYQYYNNSIKCNWCKIHELNEKNQFVEFEKYFEKNQKHYNYRHILFSGGNIMTIKRDITDEKRNIQRIKMLSDIVEQSPESIVVTNLNGDIEYVNRAFTDTTGYSLNEVIGKNPRILQSTQVEKSLYNNLWKQITNKKVWQGEFINKKKNGEIFYESAFIAPTLDENGEIINYFAIKQNITEWKKAQNAIIESEKELKEANATKDKFFSIIAHDLKGPLGSSLQLMEYLTTEHSKMSEKERERHLRVTASAIEKTYMLLENLLTWSRAQRNLIKYIPKPFYINAIIENNLMLVTPIADKKEISLFVDVAPLEVLADENTINLVIRNLLSNAIKFTSRGGKISITLTEIEKDKQKFAQLKIEDNGIGMMQEQISKLFHIDTESFSKGTEGEEGTGLGLILCKEFVEKNGGEIWVKSAVDRGSEFYFTIPRVIDKAE